MLQEINLINPPRFFTCKEYGVYFTSADFELGQSITEPLPQYAAPADYPHCCQFHKNLLADTISFVSRFPDCCSNHRKLMGAAWFDKDNYQGLAKKIFATFSHTEYHIVNRIDAADWYEDITEYIEYCIHSFGQLPDGFGPPVGLNIYLSHLQHRIKHWSTIPPKKKKKLLNYIDDFGKHHPSNPDTDLNLLLTTYVDWLKIFPFDLSIFAPLKERFQKKVPVLKNDITTNRYLNINKASIMTKGELVHFLMETTRKMLEAINTATLFEQGKISEIGKVQVELLVKSRQLQLKKLTVNGFPEKQEYIKIIEEWF